MTAPRCREPARLIDTLPIGGAARPRDGDGDGGGDARDNSEGRARAVVLPRGPSDTVRRPEIIFPVRPGAPCGRVGSGTIARGGGRPGAYFVL